MNRVVFLLITMLITFHNVKANEAIYSDTEKQLEGGWYLWSPYQYKSLESGVEILTGLDIKLTKLIFDNLDTSINYKEISWQQHINDLKDGKTDFAAGATWTKERAEFVHFTKPYRFEENALFILKDKKETTDLDIRNIKDLLFSLDNKHIKVAAIRGFIYADNQINEWLENPNNQHKIFWSSSDTTSIEAVLRGKANAFLADRVTGATALWERNLSSQFEELNLYIKTPIHYMFSKKLFTTDFIEQVNKSIKVIDQSEEYDSTIKTYLYPVLLLNIVSQNWFITIEIIGILSFSLSGIILAAQQKRTVFATLIFAALPALGGGIIRDVIFDRSPVEALSTPLYFFIVLVTVFMSVVIIRIYDYIILKNDVNISFRTNVGQKTQLLFTATDAAGLASFSVTGIIVAVIAKAEPLWLFGPVFATMTGVGGGIFRDIISGKDKVSSISGDVYSEIVVIWGFAFSLFLTLQAHAPDKDLIKYGLIGTMLTVFLTRMICYFMNIKNFYIRDPRISKKKAIF